VEEAFHAIESATAGVFTGVAGGTSTPVTILPVTAPVTMQLPVYIGTPTDLNVPLHPMQGRVTGPDVS
jgi:hypothetical protein